MVYGVHISVLVVLVGALAGSYLGFKGTMNLSEGETSDKVLVAGGESVLELPFMVRCDKFEISFYDTGAPKEFRSDLAIIDKGREVLKDSIIVNDPLTYEGITFYQANYGTTLKGAEIELTDRDSGAKIAMSLPMLQPVNIPGTGDQLTITDYRQDLMRFGQAIELTYAKAGQPPRPNGFWLTGLFTATGSKTTRSGLFESTQRDLQDSRSKKTLESGWCGPVSFS